MTVFNILFYRSKNDQFEGIPYKTPLQLVNPVVAHNVIHKFCGQVAKPLLRLAEVNDNNVT
ncbi:MAG: hypothetical protein NVS3B3_09880 [Aquirhabdus sp.]